MCLLAASLLFSSSSFQPQGMLQEHELLCLMTGTSRQGSAGAQSPLHIGSFLHLYFLPAHTDLLLQLAHKLSPLDVRLLRFPHKGSVWGRFWTNPSFCFLRYFPSSLCTWEVRNSELSAGSKSKEVVRFITITRNCNLFGLHTCTEWHMKKKKQTHYQLMESAFRYF